MCSQKNFSSGWLGDVCKELSSPALIRGYLSQDQEKSGYAYFEENNNNPMCLKLELFGCISFVACSQLH